MKTKTVSLRSLHEQTGLGIKQAASQPFLVTDHGRPIACVQPYRPSDKRNPLPDRTRELSRIPKIFVDSSILLDEDRSQI